MRAGTNLVLPAETEERVKRRALSVCQEHLRRVLDASRKVPQVIEYFIDNDKQKARLLFNEIKGGEEEVDKARRLVSQELAEIGAILISREDFLRFTNLTSEIADFLRTSLKIAAAGEDHPALVKRARA